MHFVEGSNRAIATRGFGCKRVFTGRSGRLTGSTHCWQCAEIVLHLVGGVGCLLTAFAVFDFKPPRWLPWVGCLSIGAFGATFLLQGISQLLHIDWLTYLAFQILGNKSKHCQSTFSWCGVALQCC